MWTQNLSGIKNEGDSSSTAHWKILCAESLQLRKQQIMGALQKQCEFVSDHIQFVFLVKKLLFVTRLLCAIVQITLFFFFFGEPFVCKMPQMLLTCSRICDII